MNAQPMQGTRCRARLRFGSLVGLTTLVGFCAGLLGAPIVLLMQADRLFADAFWVAIVLVGSPIAGTLNGALYGALGYPLYRWITRRVDVHTYTGEFALLDASTTREI